MRLIGVTGGIATGKSTVDRMLEAHGAAVIDADELAREVVLAGEPALDEVAARFGRDLIQPDGTLDRTRLGEIVFADPEARRDLERITHPRILELMQQRVAAALAGPAPLVAVDIPLLFENEREGMFEGVLLVYAPREVQRTRRIRCAATARRAAADRREARASDLGHRKQRRSRGDPARRGSVVGDRGQVTERGASPSSSTSSICVSSTAKADASSRRNVPMT
jgi:dephospho-CoA kinase